MNCRICGNNQGNKEIKLKGTMYGTTGEYQYFRCGKCGCLQIEDMPDDIGAFYDTGKYYAFNMEKRKLKNKLLYLQMKHQVKHFDLLGKAVQMIYPVNYYFYNLISISDALLDVGCGEGEMLCWLKELGYEKVMGIDPYIPEDRYFKGELLVCKGDAKDYRFEHKFKMVTMIHALEHVYEQQMEIAALDKLVENGGYMVFQLPVFSEYYWKEYGQNLYTLDPPRHFYLHTKKSLQELMKPFSYEMISYQTEIDVAIPKMAKNIENNEVEKNTGTGFVSGTLTALKSQKLRKRLKKEEDGAIATVVFKKVR